MTLRRLEARIRQLCAEALTVQEHETERVLKDLRETLHEHNELLRKLAANELLHRRPLIVSKLNPAKRNGEQRRQQRDSEEECA